MEDGRGHRLENRVPIERSYVSYRKRSGAKHTVAWILDKDNSRGVRLPSSRWYPGKRGKKTGCPSIVRSHLREMATGPSVHRREPWSRNTARSFRKRGRKATRTNRTNEKEAAVEERQPMFTWTVERVEDEETTTKKTKKKSAYRLVRLALIHSDPFYLENSSRKGRSISRNVLSIPSAELGDLGRPVDADSREKRSGRINGLHSNLVPILSTSGFRDQDIDLGPPNYFQDGDPCGPSAVSIEAIFGPFEKERGIVPGVQTLRIFWRRTPDRLVTLASPLETILHGFRGHVVRRRSCRPLSPDTEKIAVPNRCLASFRHCCINLASAINRGLADVLLDVFQLSVDIAHDGNYMSVCFIISCRVCYCFDTKFTKRSIHRCNQVRTVMTRVTV